VPGRYEVFEDASGQWRWRLVAGNGEVVAQSEAYTRKQDAERGVRDAVSAAKGASRHPVILTKTPND